jgi:hypothetical protein
MIVGHWPVNVPELEVLPVAGATPTAVTAIASANTPAIVRGVRHPLI